MDTRTHLGPGLQQHAHAVGVRLDAGVVQRRHVVHGHRVDRRAARDQLPQLQRPALRRRVVQRGAVRPGAFKTQHPGAYHPLY